MLRARDEMYTKYLHGIKEGSEDKITDNICNLTVTACDNIGSKPRSTRLSLTIRHVPKTSKMKLRLGRQDCIFTCYRKKGNGALVQGPQGDGKGGGKEEAQGGSRGLRDYYWLTLVADPLRS